MCLDDSVRSELDEKVRRYPNARNATIGRRLFVRKSVAKARLADVRVHTLADLYELEAES